MSWQACSENVALLRHKLINMGRMNGHARFSDDGIMTSFDTNGMEGEVDVLNRYVTELSYTRELENWINCRRRVTTQYMTDDYPARRLFSAWQNSSTQGRVDILRTVLNIHSDVYSYNAIKLTRPHIEIMNKAEAEKKNLWGGVPIIPGDLRQGIPPPIQLAPAMLEAGRNSFNDAFITVHHEHIHWVLAHLVAAWETDAINDHHLLYQDIEMQDAKLMAAAVIDCAITPCYRAQPEEILCRQQEKRFAQEYLGI